MSGAAVGLPTSPSLAPSSATVWRHNLWKDFRQVGPLIVGIAVVQIAIQLLMGLLEMAFPVDMRNMSVSSINIALAGPTLLAIACCGVLIGQERQTGTWTWNCSLPVSWQQSLFSKAVIWLGSSLVVVGVSLVIAAIALAMNSRSLVQELNPNSAENSWTYLVTILIAIQVFIYLSIAALLIKDTLMALVVAAIGLICFHSCVALMNLLDITSRLNGVPNGVNAEASVLTAYALSFLIGFIGLIVAYRWRWGAGQFVTLPTFSRFMGTDNWRPQRAAWHSFASSVSKPSELGMLFRHGIQSSIGMRLVTLVGSLLLIWWTQGMAGPFAAILSTCVFGVSVFSGDQTLGRFRFLADRGVAWRKLLVAHVTPPLVLALGIVSLTLMMTPFSPQYGSPLFAAACASVFVIGMFSAIVFPSPIISLTVAFVVIFGAFAFTSSALLTWEVIAPGYPIAILVWIPIAILLLTCVAVWTLPRWLLADRFEATGLYFGTMLVTGLLPGVLGLTLGFLTIPKVAWQGLPVEQIQIVDWTNAPQISRLYPSHSERSDIPLWHNRLPNNPGNLSARILLEIEDRVADRDEWQQGIERLIRAIEEPGATTEQSVEGNATRLAELPRMIEDSAVAALFATYQRNQELALRAWRANRKLISFCRQPALQSTVMQETIFTWEIWYTMNDDDLRFLVDTRELPNLTPEPFSSPQQFAEILRARATIGHSILNTGNFTNSDKRLAGYTNYITAWHGHLPLKDYPPIRWAYERQQALALNSDLESIGIGKVTQATQNVAPNYKFLDHAVYQYFTIQSLEAGFRYRIQGWPNSASVN